MFGHIGRTSTLDIHYDGTVFLRVNRLTEDLLISNRMGRGEQSGLAINSCTLKKRAVSERG